MCFDFPNLQLVLVQDFWAPRYVLGGYECIVVVSGTIFYDKVVVLLVSIFSIFPQKNILAHHYNWTLKSDIFRKRLKTCRFPTVNRCLDVSLHPTTSQEGQQMLPGSMELERRWWRRHWAFGWFVLAFPRCFKKKTLEVTRRLLYSYTYFFWTWETCSKMLKQDVLNYFFCWKWTIQGWSLKGFNLKHVNALRKFASTILIPKFDFLKRGVEPNLEK